MDWFGLTRKNENHYQHSRLSISSSSSTTGFLTVWISTLIISFSSSIIGPIYALSFLSSRPPTISRASSSSSFWTEVRSLLSALSARLYSLFSCSIICPSSFITSLLQFPFKKTLFSLTFFMILTALENGVLMYSFILISLSLSKALGLY